MRDLVITAFEVISLIGLALAVVMYLWRFDPALGISVGSLVLLTEALILAALEPTLTTADDE